jgi:flagellar hook protein FlgE
MGIFGAMTTAVSGMKAQSYAMENISGNIANSRTTGFKRLDTSFVDLVADRPRGQELSGSVRSRSLATNTIQGDLQTTGVAENVAINGDGFFVVRERTGFAGGVPTFGGIDVYTRRGDFERDNSGYLVNGAGFYLKGIPLDAQTGALQGSNPQLIRITENNVPPNSTDIVEYGATLPSEPENSYMRGLTSPTPADQLISAGGSGFTGATTTITGGQQSAFINRTVEGGSITVYNDQGAAKPLSLRWGKVQNLVVGPPVVPEQWNLYYQVDSDAAVGATAWQQAGTTFNFDEQGLLTNPQNINLTNFQIDGVTYSSLRLNMTDVQSFPAEDLAANRSEARVSRIQQDGYPSGAFQSVSIDNGGRVVGNYSNGQVVGLAQIVVAQFAADNALKRRDGGVYEATLESGQPVIEQAGSGVQGGTVENSNTDIADEFSKMIITQQAYSANTRVISTSSDMLRDVINIVR